MFVDSGQGKRVGKCAWVATVAELYLVRHAQASFHSADYDCLSTLGERQSVWLGEYFARRGLGFDALVTGTLRRHRQTLDGICAGMGYCAAPPPIVLDGLDEYDLRALVAAFADSHQDHPQVLAWRRDAGSKPAFYRVLKLAMTAWAEGRLPAGLPESWADFGARIGRAVAALQELSARHARVLAISSGGAMATLLGLKLDLAVSHVVDINMQIRNTALCHFHLNRERFLLSSWNAVPHLECGGRDDAITYG